MAMTWEDIQDGGSSGRAFAHGGDTFGHPGVLDFSASLNPLGMPPEVRRALAEAVDGFAAYPDPHCRALTEAIAAHEGVPASWVVPCAGATDAFARLALALRPARAHVFDPCYSGYEQAVSPFGIEVVRHREGVWRNGDGFFPATANTLAQSAGGYSEVAEKEPSPFRHMGDMIFLANPNNPTGLITPHDALVTLLDQASTAGATVVLDESFLGFTDEPSAVRLLGRFPNLVVVKSMTKLYCLAGVRVGYAVCASDQVAGRLREAGQPWAVSTPAQVAGVAALAAEPQFSQRARREVTRLREHLAAGLQDLGIRVVPGQANFLLFHAPRPLGTDLLERGILVRGSAGFVGLDAVWHRVAVRTEPENARLLEAMKEVLS